MKAIQIEKTGDVGVLQLKEIAIPSPSAGEVLVRLKASGINFADIYTRRGLYARYQHTMPFTPGMEGSGIVESVGDGVTEVKPSDRVAYAGSTGSYAEYAVVKASQLIPLPDGISFEEGAAFPLQGLTAQYLIYEFYPIKPGDVVTVHAAAGGVGLLLVQWAKYVGAKVIGTVSTDEKAALAREAGADLIINYTVNDFISQTMNFTSGRGADYIIDGVGLSTFAKDIEAVRVRGHICLFGSSSGQAEPIAPGMLMLKSITIHGGLLGNFTQSREELLHRATVVLNAIREGWLKLRIDKIFPLAQASEAHRMLESRKTTGKVILKIDD